MKYIMTFVWSLLLINMLGYVVSSVQGTDYSMALVSIVSVVVTIFIFAVDAVLPKGEPASEHH